MIIRIDADSPIPAFEQIRSQITAMAVSGVLDVGTRLPTIRQLARDLGIAPGTVARAYQELERDGVLETRGRHGSFVSEPHVGEHNDTDLDRAVETLAIRGHQLGLSIDQVVERVRRAFQSVAEQP
ncbi:MAG: GntR family transcriptional regulator [Acidimicrobiia bacterium]